MNQSDIYYTQILPSSKTTNKQSQSSLDNAEKAFSLINTDAYKYLSNYSPRRFDYIFIAPPQYRRMWKRAINLLDENKELLNDDGWIIVQIDPIEYESLQVLNFIEFDKRKYGSSMLIFFSPSL